MKHIGRGVKRAVAMFACGVSTFTLIPNSNYIQSLPSAEQLTRRSWERTGSLLREAMGRYQGIRHEQA